MATWLDEHSASCSDEQRQALTSLLRLPHISSLYLSGVVSQALPELSAGSISASDIHAAAGYAAARADVRERLGMMLQASCHPSWQLPQRPPSVADHGFLDWGVPLSQMKQLFEESAAARVVDTTLASPTCVIFQGVAWTLLLCAYKEVDGVELAVIVVPSVPPGCECVEAPLAASIALKAGSAPTRQEVVTLEVGSDRCYADAFHLDRHTAWDAAAWGKHADSDGVVHVRLTVRRVE